MLKRRAFSFQIEAVVVLLLMLFSMSVLVRVLGAARSMSDEAHDLSCAIHIAQDAAEQLAACRSADDFAALLGAGADADGTLVAVYGADGAPLADGAQAAYTLRCTCSEAPAGAGTMLCVHFTVTGNQRVLYELDSQKYLRA